MKTYGAIFSKAYEAYLAQKRDIIEIWTDWVKAVEAMEGATEAGAHAVIEEFKRRHNIVIPPEED